MDFVIMKTAPEKGPLVTVDRAPRRSPSILAITSSVPWPLDRGGHLRTFHMCRALSGEFPVRLIAGVRPGQQTLVPALREAGVELTAVSLADPSRTKDVVVATMSAIRREPFVMYARHRQARMWKAIQAELAAQPPDVVYLDHLDSFVFASLAPSLPLVVDFHNVYSRLVARTAAEQPNLALRYYLKREARLLDQTEARVARAARAMFVVSEDEWQYFSRFRANNVHIVPNGVDCAAYASLPTGRVSSMPTIMYVGAMSWMPNVNAAQFLAEEVLPRVRSDFPSARLEIVGRDPATQVRDLARLPGVVVTGSVPDVRPYLSRADVLAVPLESGGGTRLKILEAFAAGLPVISTEVGCEGLSAKDEVHLMVSPRSEFAASLVRLLKNPAEAAGRAAAARSLARDRYDWSIIGKQACQAIRFAIESSERQS
jgi:glycosyltransferase involved in cell wall biosynthesis